METFTNERGAVLVEAIIEVIQKNAAYLSEIDGAIGDGDHGVNMNKAVTLARERLTAEPSTNLARSLKVVSDTMMDDIGGSMGPLYGSLFRQMFRVTKDHEIIDGEIFGLMLSKALESIKSIGNAEVGDKTLVDTLEPAATAYAEKYREENSFVAALEAMKKAAEQGKESTIDLVAKVGRSSRLGERSRGVLDAGATSCWLILTAMADTATGLLR
jgi:dihydroxyacetone kinase-like protein